MKFFLADIHFGSSEVGLYYMTAQEQIEVASCVGY